MEKAMWKVSGVLFVTSALVGVMGGILAAPQSGVRTRKKIHKVYKETKDHVKDTVHDLKGSVANVARQGSAYRKNWLTGKGLSDWQQGFLELPSIAPERITRWYSKDAH